jgi:hypothetical protein
MNFVGREWERFRNAPRQFLTMKTRKAKVNKRVRNNKQQHNLYNYIDDKNVVTIKRWKWRQFVFICNNPMKFQPAGTWRHCYNLPGRTQYEMLFSYLLFSCFVVIGTGFFCWKDSFIYLLNFFHHFFFVLCER